MDSVKATINFQSIGSTPVIYSSMFKPLGLLSMLSLVALTFFVKHVINDYRSLMYYLMRFKIIECLDGVGYCCFALLMMSLMPMTDVVVVWLTTSKYF